jgi:hypothetical protein
MTRTGCHRHTDVPALVPDRDFPRRAGIRRLSGRTEKGDGADERCFALAGLRSLERAVATADGQQAFDAAVTAMLDDARGGVSPRCASGAA